MEILYHQNFSTWSGIRVRADACAFPNKLDDVDGLFDTFPARTFRGLGKNYCDGGLHPGHMLSSKRWNKVLHFDASRGLVRVQSGVVLRHLLDMVIPQGWIVPTIPGTAYVTVGGMVASNVHGKNQFKAGSTGDYVKSLRLLTPGRGQLECSPDTHREVFHATVGGMGSTGFILEVELQLSKLTNPYLMSSYCRTFSLEQQIGLMQENRTKADFIIGWLDYLSLDATKALGLVETGSYTQDAGRPFQARQIQVPFRMPWNFVNKPLIQLFNWVNHHKNFLSDEPIHFYDFNFKLDTLLQWNFLYGRPGLIQYQFLMPFTQSLAKNIQEVLMFLKHKNVWSSLVVLKLHKTDEIGHLSFSKDGMSIAMDFPYSQKNIEALFLLTPRIMDLGGRLYLTKDRTMDSNQFHRMYDKEIEKQKGIIANVDPRGVMESSFSKRLGLTN